MLASRVPSQDIARSKTYAIIGQGLDFTGLESSDENEDLTEVLDGLAEDKMFLRKHLLAEAKSFRELEALTESLDYMETVTSMGYLLQEYDINVHSKTFFTNRRRAQAILAEVAKGLAAAASESRPTNKSLYATIAQRMASFKPAR